MAPRPSLVVAYSKPIKKFLVKNVPHIASGNDHYFLGLVTQLHLNGKLSTEYFSELLNIHKLDVIATGTREILSFRDLNIGHRAGHTIHSSM